MPQNGINTPELTLMEDARKIETINFNPAVDCVLATSSQDALNLWDIIAAEQIYSFDVSILYLTTFKTALALLIRPTKQSTLKLQ